MRSTHFLVFLLCVGVANAQFSGIISGFVEGLTEGGIKGVVGAWAPLVKDGMTMMYNVAQTMIRTSLNLIDQLIKTAPQLFSTIQNTFGGILQTGTNMISGLTGAGKYQMHAITMTAQHGVTGSFATFAKMTKKDQKSAFGVIDSASRVALTVAKLRINSLKTADKEVLAIRKVMETPNQTPQQLVAALKKKAPKLSEFAKTAFGKASAEYHAGASKLDKSAQAGLKMMQDSLKMSQKGVEHILGAMNGSVKKEFGPTFHLLSNTMHVVNAAT